MTNHFVTATGANTCYFSRPPEHLVLEGYRHWSAGYDTGSIQPWEMAWDIYENTLGTLDGRAALAELSGYIRVLRRCASCPLRAFPFHSHHFCIEECLTLGLIAGLQHDDETAELCLRHITCSLRCDEVRDAAASFAETLREFDQVLLPIPGHVIADVTSRNTTNSYH